MTDPMSDGINEGMNALIAAVAERADVAPQRVRDAANRAFDAVFRAVADGGDAWVHGIGRLHLDVGPPASIRLAPSDGLAAALGVEASPPVSHNVAQLPGNLTASTGMTGQAITELVEAIVAELAARLAADTDVPWPGVGRFQRSGDGFGVALEAARQTELEGAQGCQWARLKASLGE